MENGMCSATTRDTFSDLMQSYRENDQLIYNICRVKEENLNIGLD